MRQGLSAVMIISVWALTFLFSGIAEGAEQRQAASRTDTTGPAELAPEAEGQFVEYQGSILSVDCKERAITILDKKKMKKTLSIVETTRFRGKLTCADLKQGDWVSGGYTVVKGNREVQSIGILKGRKPGSDETEKKAMQAPKGQVKFVLGSLRSIDCNKGFMMVDDSQAKGKTVRFSLTTATGFESNGTAVKCDRFAEEKEGATVSVVYEIGTDSFKAKKVKKTGQN